MVAMERPHLLILDEPTNHLDIDSRRALTQAINDYSGAVILITHDRSLMEMVADRLWLVSDGSVKPFDGDMDDYARFVLDRARNANKVKAPNPVSLAPAPAPRAAPAPLKRKLDAAEQVLARETKLVAELDDTLAVTSAPDKIAELEKRRARTVERLGEAEAKWIAAAEAYDAAMAAA